MVLLATLYVGLPRHVRSWRELHSYRFAKGQILYPLHRGRRPEIPHRSKPLTDPRQSVMLLYLTPQAGNSECNSVN
jgi:hypothetical protein